MNEYIKRDVAINFVEKYTPNFDGETTMQCVRTALENAPAADVKEVVHAKWEWFDAWEGDDAFGKWMTLRCSHCLETEGARENAKYCSNCGAIMDLD